MYVFKKLKLWLSQINICFYANDEYNQKLRKNMRTKALSGFLWNIQTAFGIWVWNSNFYICAFFVHCQINLKVNTKWAHVSAEIYFGSCAVSITSRKSIFRSSGLLRFSGKSSVITTSTITESHKISIN